jgi:CelD/BcsL family acetyltransferase involved in cellulose biosynthesis
MPKLRIEVRPPDEDLAPHWRDLVGRASGNAFADPSGLKAACEQGFAEPFVMLAWDDADTPARLVGLMALRAQKTPGLPARHLWSQAQDYAFVSNPVVDPACGDEVMRAFFAEIARRPDLPKIVRFQHLDGSDPSYDAIAAALAAPLTQSLILEESETPIITREAGMKRSGSTRKKLRQHWNRLAATGAVDVVNERSEAAARDALETFLVMEAAGWKGERGSAILSSARDTAFVRAFVAAMAAHGNASVALLRIDGRPIAAQVLFYAGAKAYTWKTAYDAAYGDFSPGALLIERLTAMLFEEGGIAAIDSCSNGGGFMATLWEGRRPTLDLLVELGPRRSLAFHMIVAHVRGMALIRIARQRLRAGYTALKRARTAPAAGQVSSG